MPILGNPGITSRDDAIFSGERHFWRESLLQELKSPCALFLSRRVPEEVEIRPADWPEKYFSFFEFKKARTIDPDGLNIREETY